MRQYPSQFIFTFNLSKHPATYVNAPASVPGEGLVAAQIGKIVFFFTDPDDEEPDVIFEAGQHEGDILAALCQALA